MQKEYRQQQNITVSVEQADFLKANKATMSIGKLATMLGITKNKCYNNLKVLSLTGTHKQRRKITHYKKPKEDNCIVVDFDTNGNFDINKFSKYYQL